MEHVLIARITLSLLAFADAFGMLVIVATRKNRENNLLAVTIYVFGTVLFAALAGINFATGEVILAALEAVASLVDVVIVMFRAAQADL